MVSLIQIALPSDGGAVEMPKQQIPKASSRLPQLCGQAHSCVSVGRDIHALLGPSG